MGNLFVVATPIGNLSDLSQRAIDTLKNCDFILAEDTRQTIKLFNHFEIKNKMISYHKYNELKRTEEIIEQLKNGKNIALVSDAGTPCISDPGYILVKKARENNIKVIGIPGCSAVITALSISGLDTSSFTFYGFVPNNNKEKKELFEDIKTSKVKTKVLYESPKRVLNLLKDIKKEMPGCMVSVCSELTKVYERCIYGKIEEVYEKMCNFSDPIKGEFVILISNNFLTKIDNDISIEALIMDSIIKNNCSIKEAVEIVNKQNNNITKKDIYNAGVKLKKILK